MAVWGPNSPVLRYQQIIILLPLHIIGRLRPCDIHGAMKLPARFILFVNCLSFWLWDDWGYRPAFRIRTTFFIVFMNGFLPRHFQIVVLTVPMMKRGIAAPPRSCFYVLNIENEEKEANPNNAVLLCYFILRPLTRSTARDFLAGNMDVPHLSLASRPAGAQRVQYLAGGSGFLFVKMANLKRRKKYFRLI